MESYFHRAGRRVPVYVSSCAFVVPRAPEALQPAPAWAVVPLARRHALLVRRSLLDRIGRPEPDRRTILRWIRADARAPLLAPDDVGDPPLPDATPVLVRKALLLCPTGAVVAQFPAGTSAATAAHAIRADGWAVERPIRFLDRGYVLRADARQAPVDPLTLANGLVERHGCRFAHPVMLEEVVGSEAQPREAA